MLTGDLKTVVKKLELIIQRQIAIRKTCMAENIFGYRRFCEFNQLFAEIIRVINSWALRKVAQQLPHITLDMSLCLRVFRKIPGLPYKYILNQRLINDESLHATNFFKKWWFPDTRVANGRVLKQIICRTKNSDVA